MVKETGSAIGLAFDGDSDRLIAVDENGDIVDGDKVMYIIGKHLSQKGELAKNTIVTTVMSNLGFHKALDREGINKAVTAVGDRYVVEEMRKNGYNLGGEQSGPVSYTHLDVYKRQVFAIFSHDRLCNNLKTIFHQPDTEIIFTIIWL